MGEDHRQDGPLQQPADDRRRQADQQNRQGERRDGAELERARTNPLDDGLEGGVDTGAIEPGKTGL